MLLLLDATGSRQIIKLFLVHVLAAKCRRSTLLTSSAIQYNHLLLLLQRNIVTNFSRAHVVQISGLIPTLAPHLAIITLRVDRVAWLQQVFLTITTLVLIIIIRSQIIELHPSLFLLFQKIMSTIIALIRGLLSLVVKLVVEDGGNIILRRPMNCLFHFFA